MDENVVERVEKEKEQYFQMNPISSSVFFSALFQTLDFPSVNLIALSVVSPVLCISTKAFLGI